jgi:alkylation response protein AidB-like acyl-CoA dehydrogenase
MSEDDRQQRILDEARQFADTILRPQAASFDRKESLPRSVITALAEKHYLLPSLPEAAGGLGLNPLHYGFFIEEIGKACCSTRGLITVQSSLVGETLRRWGTTPQKKKWLPLIARGEKIGAFALSEPEIGTDARHVKTEYRKSDRGFIVNGRKKWISFAEIADFFIVFAARDQEVTAFIIEKNRKGVRTIPQKGLLGNRAAHLAEIVLQDVQIPANHVIGRVGSGFEFVANTALDHGRYSIAWAAVAIAQESLNAMAAYARQREQFGQKIGEFQLVQRMIANAVTKTHAARALCVRAGKLRVKRGVEDSVMETAIAKFFSSKIAMEVAADAVQVHGGNGCSSAFPVERLFREAKILEIIEGTSQIQQLTIAKYGLRTYGKPSQYYHHG